MTGPAKRKGDRAELEAAELLTELFGVPVRRRLGAGRSDDTGDLDGLDDHTIQVANWQDIASAVRIKPDAAEQQRLNAGTRHAVTLIRLRGGAWRVVQTLDQWATYVRPRKDHQ